MKQLTLRDIPEEVVQALREEAAERGQSMNAVARSALAEHVERRRWSQRLRERLPVMDALRNRIARRHGRELDDSAALVRADRER